MHPFYRPHLPPAWWLIVGQLFFTSAGAVAFEPPVDSAGPLTVRIEGPETVDQVETPQPVRVLLQNKGPTRVAGQVRLQGIDLWRCTPDGEVPFQVAAGETISLDFQVTAGQGTLAAHYPLHAWVSFEATGQSLTAHPVLVLEARPPAPKMKAPAAETAWKPWTTASPRTLALWRLPVWRSVFEIFGQPPQAMPPGWTEAEPASRGSVRLQPGCTHARSDPPRQLAYADGPDRQYDAACVDRFHPLCGTATLVELRRADDQHQFRPEPFDEIDDRAAARPAGLAGGEAQFDDALLGEQ